MTTLQEKIVEKNTWNHKACPNCGKLFQMENRDGPIELSTRCDRCHCPLNDIPAAIKFIDEQAEGETDSAITLMGKKLRGETELPLPEVDLETIKADLRVDLMQSFNEEIRLSIAKAVAEAIPALVSAVTVELAQSARTDSPQDGPPAPEGKPKGGK